MHKFKRTHTEFQGGETYEGKDLHSQRVVIVNEVYTEGEEDVWRIQTADGAYHEVDGCDLHPHPESRATNVEFVTHLMEHASTPMVQAFVIEGLSKYAAMILEEDAEKLSNGFISGEAWQNVAKEVHDAVEEHYKS